MTTNDREIIVQKTRLRLLLRRICAGVEAIVRTPYKGLFVLAFWAIMLRMWMSRDAILGLDKGMLFAPVLDAATKCIIVIVAVVGTFVVVGLIGTPFGSRATRENLQKIGLTNHAGEAPILMTKQQDVENLRLTVWEFESQGIPLSVWEDKRDSLEAALDVTIVRIRHSKGKSRIMLYTVPARADLPERLEWRDEYLSPDSFVLTLGESFTGPVIVNLAQIPHILIGGSTGSGKSVLLKLLLTQALRKGAVVSIADFKGGADYSSLWRKKCQMCFNERDLLGFLTELVDELERRKVLFQASECPNIDAYNQLTGEGLRRCIFACDEVAELLDKTGADSDRKKLLAQIESKLTTIARQGRAFGIHLILATQRPDATIIPGQIRNNMDFRVCGRADKVLSQIILDCTDAADLIPKDAQGRFLLQDGTVFQAYWFDDSNW
jgi:S-DNA-T family DNA segregation ATPase FtsK/SpoIIIE